MTKQWPCVSLMQVWLWEVLWSFLVQPLSWSSKIHFLLHVTIWSINGLLFLGRIREDKMIIFLRFLSAHEAPTYWTFSPFHFASNAGFLGIFSCSYKRINFDDPFSWSLSNSDRWPQCSSSSSLSSPLQKLLEAPQHCTFTSSFWAKYVIDVVSCLFCFMIHLNSNKKIAQICFLSNFVSLV